MYLLVPLPNNLIIATVTIYHVNKPLFYFLVC